MTGSIPDVVVRRYSHLLLLLLLHQLLHQNYYRVQSSLLLVRVAPKNPVSSHLYCSHLSSRRMWMELKGSPRHSSRLHYHRRGPRMSTASLASTSRVRSNEAQTHPRTTALSVVEVIEGKNGEVTPAISPHTMRPSSTSTAAWKRTIRTTTDDAVAAAAHGLDGENASCSRS